MRTLCSAIHQRQHRTDLHAEIQNLIASQRLLLPQFESFSTCNRFTSVLIAADSDPGPICQDLHIVLACLKTLQQADSVARAAALSDVLRSMHSAIKVLSRSAFSRAAK
jgi:hypothetical protein